MIYKIMELRIGYAEAAGLVAKAVGSEVELRYCAADEVTVAVKVKVLFATKWVSVNLKVERVEGNDVICSYSGAFGVGALIKGALAFLKGMFPEVVKMVDVGDDGRLVLHLDEVEQLEKALEMVTLQGVSFSPDAINVAFSLK